jgi:hypothetical protein
VSKSFANGNGGIGQSGPDMRSGSPVPPVFRSPVFLDAKAVTTTFWEFL